jgi:rhodanese-related sulfurtransferase
MPERLRISPADAKARVDAHQAIVVDVVSPQAWGTLDKAVPGAIRISPEEFGQRFGELPRERAIITYCT